MFTLVRALTYAVLFVGTFLVFLPGEVLRWSGVVRPAALGVPQIAGALLVVLGGAIALACVLTFATIGRGTPAPFDPPRRLVTRGPYGVVRNPMYWGAGLALAGAALFYRSAALAGYVALYFVVLHVFVLAYEEPTLRRAFGPEYEGYCRDVRRWWPRLRPRAEGRGSRA